GQRRGAADRAGQGFRPGPGARRGRVRALRRPGRAAVLADRRIGAPARPARRDRDRPSGRLTGPLFREAAPGHAAPAPVAGYSVVFFAVAFLVVFLAAVFLVVVFLAAVFFAVAFFAVAFLAAAFFVVFLAVFFAAFFAEI